MVGHSKSSLQAGILAVLFGAAPHGAAAEPTELYQCITGSDYLPVCRDQVGVLHTDFSCRDLPHNYLTYYGRVGFGPLEYIGPIIIEVNARHATECRLPLYVEVVPLAGTPAPCDVAGTVVLEVYGSVECDGLERSPILDLFRILQIGELYIVRLHFEEPPGLNGCGSPPFGCIRVRPSTTSAIPATWGLVKSLYRELGQ